jgi:hypothetical protein
MAINDVTDAFGDWLELITGTRNPGSYVNGRWIDDVPIDISFYGVVQNSEPRDLLVLEEGNRTSESIKIHTIFRLYPEIASTHKGDIINYDNEQWLIYNVAYRFIGNYNKALAIKL